jgi:uncharacterized protein DUF4157
MAPDRNAQRATATIERRRPAAPEVQRSAAPAKRSAARTLQERLGNQGVSALAAKLPSKVSKPTEAAELEAEATARKVTRMSEPPAGKPAAPRGAEKGTLQRAEAATAASAAPAAAARSAPSAGIAGGAPLPAPVRGFMEPRFGAGFGNVRVHTGEAAAQQSAALGAHAFTVGEHVFFGRGKFQPQSAGGRELIAHELTHTIQQGAAVQASVQRSADVTVTQRSAPRVQRFGVSDALDWIADKASYIPGFRLLTVVLGMNPINWAPVERSGANLLRGMLELVPVTGPLVVEALDNYGIIDKVGDWADGKVRSLGLVGSALKRGLDEFLDSLSWSDIFDLDDVYERGKRIFTDPIDQLIELAGSMIADVLGFIREAILLPLAALAEGTSGYDLLKAVLEQDPITGAPVARNPDTLIGGFMKLIGQEEVWENAKKANAGPRVIAWFEAALSGLLGFVLQIPTLFLTALKSLEIIDLVLPPKAFLKIAAVFGGFALQFFTWAGSVVWNLLEIVFDVVSPGALVYVKKTGAALKSILLDPIPFVLNLVKAAKLGFDRFTDRFLEHLKAGLIDWLVGSLPGIYIPKAFSLPEIAKFAFSALGLTWANIREKLVKATNETTVKALESGFDVVVTLVRDGPAAAWDKIQAQLVNLKDMVIGGIVDLIVGIVTKKAIPKLLALFVPGAGFVSAILSIYDTVMVFVDKIARMVEVVKSFVDSIVAIAAGAVDTAAARVENALAGVLKLAINFLAAFAGLGNVADKVMAVIEKVRAPIDKALDWLVDWIVKAAKTVISKGKAAVGKLLRWAFAKKTFKDGEGKQHSLYVSDAGVLTVASAPMAALEFVNWYEKTHNGDAKIAGEARGLIAEAQKVVVEIEKETTKPEDVPAPAKQQKLLALNTKISEKLSQLVGRDPKVASDLEKKYLLEGQVGTYATIPKPVGDSLTPDHQPQASIILGAADFFKDRGIEGEGLSQRAEGRAAQGYAINLHFKRHVAGATYGSKGETRKGFYQKLVDMAKGKTLKAAKEGVVTMLRAALGKDVAQMKSVAAAKLTDPPWAQLNEEFKHDPPKAQTLKDQIADRIVKGENQVASQPFEL